jgi:hypothetical protein
MIALLQKPRFYYGFIFSVFFVYVTYRAYILGITYDESWTLRSFVDLSFMEILNCTSCDANNHILNTLLIKLLSNFNDTLFIVRLPSVFAFLLYSYFGYKICFNFLNTLFGICVFIVLLSNPFVLDFFSLARGYSLALGFQMMAIYYFIQFFQSLKYKHVILSLTSGVFMVMSNFSFLTFWLALAFMISLYSFYIKKQIILKKVLLSIFCISFILLALLYEPIRKMMTQGNFYYGGNSDFYSDTLISLTKYSLYSPIESSLTHWILNLFLIVIIGGITYSFFDKSMLKRYSTLLLVLIIICITALILQYYLFGTLYLIDRTALFFYPLCILLFGFVFHTLYQKYKHWIILAVLGIFTTLFVLNFTSKANTYKTATWFFDAHSSEILEQFNEIGKKSGTPVKIDYSWPFESSFQYYTTKNKYDYIELVKNPWNREVFNPNADYFVFLNHSLEKVGYEIEHQKIIDTTKIIKQSFESEHIIIYTYSKD